MVFRVSPHRFLGWTTLVLGLLCGIMVTAAFTRTQRDLALPGYVLRTTAQTQTAWKVIGAAAIESGAILPANTNVIIELPTAMRPILRRVLFGTAGDTVRYWGYCLPENYDREDAMNMNRLPGKVFLSLAERKIREETYQQKIQSRLTLRKGLSEAELNNTSVSSSIIRHEFEEFDPGDVCYVMSERNIPIGIDRDNDGANEKVEQEYGTNPLSPDTDEDGIEDGREIFFLHTNPLSRDSDGDGLIDGIEDANHNGHTDANETDPMQWDTDRDGLPDGLMKMGNARNTVIKGEDKNLNGMVDEGEYDPRKWSTAGNGVSDSSMYYQCILTGGTDC